MIEIDKIALEHNGGHVFLMVRKAALEGGEPEWREVAKYNGLRTVYFEFPEAWLDGVTRIPKKSVYE